MKKHIVLFVLLTASHITWADQVDDDINAAMSRHAGIRSISFLAVQNVGERGIERHGGKVTRVLYCRMLTDGAPRRILIYLTEDGLVRARTY